MVVLESEKLVYFPVTAVLPFSPTTEMKYTPLPGQYQSYNLKCKFCGIGQQCMGDYLEQSHSCSQ